MDAGAWARGRERDAFVGVNLDDALPVPACPRAAGGDNRGGRLSGDVVSILPKHSVQQDRSACPGGTQMDRPPRGPRGHGRVQGAMGAPLIISGHSPDKGADLVRFAPVCERMVASVYDRTIHLALCLANAAGFFHRRVLGFQ